MYTTNENQNSSPRESLEFCPHHSLQGTSASLHRTVQWLPTCQPALSTPPCLVC